MVQGSVNVGNSVINLFCKYLYDGYVMYRSCQQVSHL